MGLFTTQSKRTYRKPRQRAGYSTTLKAKTRLKRWAKRRTKQLWRSAKRRTKQLWRKTKARIRRSWKQRQHRRAIHKRQIARNAQRFQQRHAKIHAQIATPTTSYESDSGQLEGQVKLPPPDGAIASCRRCANEVQYSVGHGRWEHTGHGHYECFQPHR
jgi:hypothetical protein